MKNKLQLIVAGGMFAAVAWMFWRMLGKDAFSALPTVMLVVVMADNARLRRRLRGNPPTQK